MSADAQTKPVTKNLNAQGALFYKCRRCGEIDGSVGVPNVQTALVNLTLGLPMPEEWGAGSVHLIDLHGCDDGGIGITDCIGGDVAG